MARTPEAVLEATACVVDGGWGTYRQFHAIFTFYAANRRSRTFLARDSEGRVAATSVATRYARTGWIGHVFVRPGLRGHGLGTRMTSAALSHLQRAGCDPILLVSTELGRPIYDRLGFKIESSYHELRGTALPKTVELAPFRPLMPSDRTALPALDRQVSGDDRGPLLSRFEDFAWGVSRDGSVAGAVVPLPWGGAWAALLPGAGDAETAAMVRLLRTVGSVGPEVIVYPPDENRLALDLLREGGFEELRTVPRMVLGRRSEWLPAAVWNPMSLGLG
ncbi:MAG TPA: GNAT family N-acetyltransferase [Clostridia bacterium]|nr:GNAT family N-acetyltransferase [Clostridia bacterium]